MLQIAAANSLAPLVFEALRASSVLVLRGTIAAGGARLLGAPRARPAAAAFHAAPPTAVTASAAPATAAASHAAHSTEFDLLNDIEHAILRGEIAYIMLKGGEVQSLCSPAACAGRTSHHRLLPAAARAAAE